MSHVARLASGLGLSLLLGASDAGAASMGSLAPRSQTAATTAQQQWLTDPHTGCRALDSEFAPGDSIAWRGACVAGTASGAGNLVFFNDGHNVEAVAGTFGDGALLPGNVSAVWSDGSRYDGGQAGGQFEGSGIFLSAAGDRIDGQWKSGALDGKASVTWANGDRYQGEWKVGKSDGEGTETWANGDRYEGRWRDGKPVASEESDSGDRATAPVLSSAAPAQSAAATPTAVVPARATEAVPTASGHPEENAGISSPLENFVGQRLVAVDGSTIELAFSEGGLSRTVTLPNGVSEQLAFTFLGDRIGTVSNDAAAVGLFRTGAEEIDSDYTDGKTEVMKASENGRLLMTLRNADGSAACTAWYPAGHEFSQEEKRSAVAEYARRMGVSDAAPQKKHRLVAGKATCGGAFLIGPAASGTALSVSAPASGSEMTAAAHAVEPTPVRAKSPAAPAGASDTLHAVSVRDAAVHLIDAPYDTEAAPPIESVAFATGPVSQAVPQAVPGASPAASALSATECLSVASDGRYWGFRNRCGNALQFAYCEMSDIDPLTSCRHTSVSGSVTANGFSPLVSDRSLSERSVDHEFRWMACEGGAGEVVPRLDNVEPPGGRCLRAAPVGSADLVARTGGS